tara:strand:+ start:2380 stop:2484 length:105 start_codon:yes stop_codon:yes gene_type:complete
MEKIKTIKGKSLTDIKKMLDDKKKVLNDKKLIKK